MVGLLGGYYGISLFLSDSSNANWGPFFAALAGAIGWALHTSGRQPTQPHTGIIRIDAEGIHVDEVCIVRRADVALRAPLEIRGGQLAMLRTKRGPVDVESFDQSVSTLAQLLIAVWRTRPCFRAYKSARWGPFPAMTIYFPSSLLLGLVASRILPDVSISFMLGPLLGILMTIVALQLIRRTDVTIGDDGLELRALLRRTRTIPYAQIEHVKKMQGAAIEVSLRGGEGISLDFGMFAASEHDPSVRALSLVTMIERSRTACAAAAAAGNDASSLLARGGRTVDEWLRALRSVGDRQASFRSATLSEDQLWTIVGDPSQLETVRAAAAVALRGDLDEPGRARLRVAADACVAVKLRVALEAASQADQRLLEEALGNLDDHSAKRQAQR